MRILSLLLITGICVLFITCKKEESKPCHNVPAGTDLRYRIVDTGGHDLLYASYATLIKDSLHAWQPCRTDSLVPLFTKYRIPGTTDSGYVLRFGNLRTPDYGERGECYRVFFRWSSTDVDTFDWHYRVEAENGCDLQIIDYVSYNGILAEKKYDNLYEYYKLVKQ